jgi:hypothetical protein
MATCGLADNKQSHPDSCTLCTSKSDAAERPQEVINNIENAQCAPCTKLTDQHLAPQSRLEAAYIQTLLEYIMRNQLPLDRDKP